ncbi:hypothetical protein HK096_002103 [Nowakowskiella sp. JEL0078]|nr:hypothetical protein HK096_002103 [Nowakowskiella sp. JEL0078]
MRIIPFLALISFAGIAYAQRRQTCLYAANMAFCLQDVSTAEVPQEPDLSCVFANQTSAFFNSISVMPPDPRCPVFMGIAASAARAAGGNIFLSLCCRGNTCNNTLISACAADFTLVLCFGINNGCSWVGGVCVPAQRFGDTTSNCPSYYLPPKCSGWCSSGRANAEPPLFSGFDTSIPPPASPAALSSSASPAALPPSASPAALPTFTSRSSPNIGNTQTQFSPFTAITASPAIAQQDTYTGCTAACIAGIVSSAAAVLSAIVAALALLFKRNKQLQSQNHSLSSTVEDLRGHVRELSDGGSVGSSKRLYRSGSSDRASISSGSGGDRTVVWLGEMQGLKSDQERQN